MERRNAEIVVVMVAAFGFLSFVPVLSMPEYQAQAQACGSRSAPESAQAEPEPFEPCTVPEFGSVTYAVIGTGGVWMEDEYAHYYVLCAFGPTNCT